MTTMYKSSVYIVEQTNKCIVLKTQKYTIQVFSDARGQRMGAYSRQVIM